MTFFNYLKVTSSCIILKIGTLYFINAIKIQFLNFYWNTTIIYLIKLIHQISIIPLHPLYILNVINAVIVQTQPLYLIQYLYYCIHFIYFSVMNYCCAHEEEARNIFDLCRRIVLKHTLTHLFLAFW